MTNPPRALRFGPWILAGLISLAACGDDDNAVTETDAGTHCNPLVGGASSCYCGTGTQGIRYCRAQPTGSEGQWSECMCNEPNQPFMCTEGSLLSCMCPDGTPSQRTCRAANTVDACMCAGHMGMDSGVDDAGDNDAG